MLQRVKNLTPLSSCIIAATAANLCTAVMIGWFLMAKPYVRVYVDGGTLDYVDGGTVSVKGGTVKAVVDEENILKVKICDDPTRCASVDPSGPVSRFFTPYGLSVIPARNP